MATSRGGSKPPKKKQRKARRGVDVSQPALDLDQVRALCLKMAESPSIETALDLEIRSGELQGFFGTIRDRAARYRRAVQEGKRAEQESRESLAALERSFRPEPVGSPPATPPAAGAEVPAARGGEEFFETFMPASAKERETLDLTGLDGGFDLKDFFQSVSSAVVNAQQSLNQSSLYYARQLVGTPIPPSVYSIPNVKAEVKLGITVDDGGIIKAIFGGGSKTSSESTITFDIAASPPPAGKIGDYTSPVPPFLAVAGQERDQAVAAIRQLGAGAPSDKDWESRAVVLRDVTSGLAASKTWFALVLVPAPPPKPADPPPDPNAVDLSLYAVDAKGAKSIVLSRSPLNAAAVDIARAALVHTARSIAAWVSSVRVPAS